MLLIRIGSGIDEQNIAEMEAGLVKSILLNESGIFYKINIIYCAELSATNCRAELSAPNCPAPNYPGTMYVHVCMYVNSCSFHTSLKFCRRHCLDRRHV